MVGVTRIDFKLQYELRDRSSLSESGRYPHTFGKNCTYTMKNLLSILTCCLFVSQVAWAGGTTSIVTLTKITEIKIESDRITVRGDATISFGIRTTEEHAEIDPKRTRWPRRTVDAHSPNVEFEIVPYFTKQKFEGVPSGGHATEELRTLSAEWWHSNLEKVKRFKVGDSMKIVFQGEAITVSDGVISHLIGYGMVYDATKSNN